MPKLIRSACLTHYVEVARSVGLDPYRQLKAAGLSRACLADLDTMIRVSAVVRLLEASAQAVGVEHFGLRMAETRRLSILGSIGLLLQEEPTVRKALASLARYLRLHTDSLSLGIEEDGETAIIREERIIQARNPSRQVASSRWARCTESCNRCWAPSGSRSAYASRTRRPQLVSPTSASSAVRSTSGVT